MFQTTHIEEGSKKEPILESTDPNFNEMVENVETISLIEASSTSQMKSNEESDTNICSSQMINSKRTSQNNVLLRMMRFVNKIAKAPIINKSPDNDKLLIVMDLDLTMIESRPEIERGENVDYIVIKGDEEKVI